MYFMLYKKSDKIFDIYFFLYIIYYIIFINVKNRNMEKWEESWYIPEDKWVIRGGEPDESKAIGSNEKIEVVPLGRVWGFPKDLDVKKRRDNATDAMRWSTLARRKDIWNVFQSKNGKREKTPQEEALEEIKVTQNPKAVMKEIEWTEVNINLPAVWSFKWFELKYFISKSDKYRNEIESLSENLFSTKDIAEMLVNMYDYMEAKGTPIKERILDKKRETLRRELTHEEKMEEYEEKLKNYNWRRNPEDWCMAWHLLKEKFGWKDKTFWVRDDETNKIVVLNMRSDDKFLFTDVGTIEKVVFKM